MRSQIARSTQPSGAPPPPPHSFPPHQSHLPGHVQDTAAANPEEVEESIFSQSQVTYFIICPALQCNSPSLPISIWEKIKPLIWRQNYSPSIPWSPLTQAMRSPCSLLVPEISLQGEQRWPCDQIMSHSEGLRVSHKLSKARKVQTPKSSLGWPGEPLPHPGSLT